MSLRSLSSLLALCILLLGALAIFILTFDANRYKPELAAWVKEQTGRELVIDGKVSLSVYPAIALTANNVKLSNASGFKPAYFAQAQQARFAIELKPLFEQKLQVHDVLLQGLQLHLTRQSDGRTNWQDLSKNNKPNEQVQQVLTRLLGNFIIAGVSVQDAALQWDDEQANQHLTLAPLDLTTATLRPGKPVDIKLQTHIKQLAPVIDATVDASSTVELAADNDNFTFSNTKASVQLANKPSQGDTLKAELLGNLKGNLTNKTFNTQGLSASIDLNRADKTTTHADVKGTLQAHTADGNYAIPDLTASVQVPNMGKLDVAGQLQANTSQEQLSLKNMQVQAELNTPKLGQARAQLQADMQMATATQVITLNAMRLKATTQQGPAGFSSSDITATGQTHIELAQQQLSVNELQLTSHLLGGALPNGGITQNGQGQLALNWGNGQGLLDLTQTTVDVLGETLQGSLQVHDPLAQLYLNGNFKAAQLRYPPFELQQATLGLDFQQGKLTLTPKGRLFKGGYEGEIIIDTTQKPATVSMTHKTDKLRTEELFFALTQDKTITGALNLTANLTSQVGDAQQFKQHLNGSINVDLRDGTIRDANFAQKVKQVVTLFEREHVNDLGEKEVVFTTLGGQWQVKDGVFQSEDQLLTAPHFQVQGKGDVDIAQETLNVKLRVGEKPKADQAQGLFAPLHIHGPWKQLSYALELDVLVKELAQQALEQQKDKLTAQLEVEKQKQIEALQTEKQKQIDALQDKRKELTNRLQQELADEKNKMRERLQTELHQQLKGFDQLPPEQTQLTDPANERFRQEVQKDMDKSRERLDEELRKRATNLDALKKEASQPSPETPADPVSNPANELQIPPEQKMRQKLADDLKQRLQQEINNKYKDLMQK